MRAIRLAQAIDQGALTLPQDGRILVFRPQAGEDLSGLASAVGNAQLEVVTGFAPDAAWFAAAGYSVMRVPAPGAAAAIVCMPRARAMAQSLLAMADATVTKGATIVVDGQKTDGIEPIQRALAKRGAAPSAAFIKAHGRLFQFAAGAGLSDWAGSPQVLQTGQAAGFYTAPGVFSADGADPASILLAQSLPERLGARVADLGAGWGYLAAQVLKHPGVEQVTLIEAEADALDCARLNVTDARARFVWSDALTWQADAPLDLIVCNPPFHAGREADPALGAAFVRAAAQKLSGSGTLWLVANRHLPYAEPLQGSFREVTEVAATSAFRVWRAARPQTRNRKT